MFDIGMPEFIIIAIVALVVLGPERIPEVMARLGRAYRQLRQMSDEVTGEFRRQWEAGMREVEDISSTVSDAWQEATADRAKPPPALRQVPPALRAPTSAAEAGPWALPAAYQDTVPPVDPQPAEYPRSPFTWPPPIYASADLELAGIGGPMLMGPALPDLDVSEMLPVAEDLPDEADLPPAEDLPLPALPVPAASEASTARSMVPVAPMASAHLTLAGAVAGEVAQEPVAPSPVPGNGSPEPPAQGAGPNGYAEHVLAHTRRVLSERERTVVELYRRGGISLAKAAEFLNVTPGDFTALAEEEQPVGGA